MSAERQSPQKSNLKIGLYWDGAHKKVFNDIKAMVTHDVVLAYPDFSQLFEIYTDASKTQLGAVISQNNRPIAFFQ